MLALSLVTHYQQAPRYGWLISPSPLFPSNNSKKKLLNPQSQRGLSLLLPWNRNIAVSSRLFTTRIGYSVIFNSCCFNAVHILARRPPLCVRENVHHLGAFPLATYPVDSEPSAQWRGVSMWLSLGLRLARDLRGVPCSPCLAFLCGSCCCFLLCDIFLQ